MVHTARVLRAFATNDLKNVLRDPLLLSVALAPLLAVALLRLLVPLVAGYLERAHGFDLVPYYPLLLGVFLIGLPMGFGSLAGFMILDERDDDTLTALRVTPASMYGYASYRIAASVLLSFAYVIGCVSFTGLLPAYLISDLVPAALLAGLSAPIVALLLPALAGNKVEGLAIGKALGLFILGPAAAYFVGSEWQLLFGVLPTYWPAKAFWVAAAGGDHWPYVLAGFTYNLLLSVVLLRRFARKTFSG